MHWKTRGRIAAAALLTLGALAANVEPTFVRADERVAPDRMTGQERETARSEALQHLDRFLAHTLDADATTATGATLKIALPPKNGRREEIWVEAFEALSGGFSGHRTQGSSTELHIGAREIVLFNRTDIRDWAFWGEDGRLYGNFTARALLPRMHPNDAARMTTALSTTPFPSSWGEFREPHDFSLADTRPSL